MAKLMSRGWVVAAALVLCAGEASANNVSPQVTGTDTIAGTVTGPGGQPLAGAIVQATSSVTRLSRWQTSDDRGRFTIQFPGRAPYELTAHYFGLVPERGGKSLWARQDRGAASIRLELAGIENPIDQILGAYGVLGLTGDQISRLRDVAASSNSVTLPVLERVR
ncbi:MAG TPA: carboxypeptidase-like regulatory domain-containing protein, partial [Gemmatimonadales bacterium]|nr:carboxypeptidase-like regulatory domain-containing protein [Gemmatimonadales bacterium]